MRRDALVAYLIGPGPAVALTPPLLSSDDIFNRFLIDPEMCACGLTTRLLEASLAVQQFVQQCFLGLVTGVSVDSTVDPGWNQWSWMSQFRRWQANRQVFLYPENYLLPELRTDQSPFFVDFENELKQSNCDADATAAAFENYLRKLVEVRNLVVAAHYHETRADGSVVLHVFAKTRGTPPKWYYRTRAEGSFGSGIWSAWEALNLDITSEHLAPVIWDQRLHLVWPIFKQISEKASAQNIPTTSGGAATPSSAPPARKFWTVEFAMSELSAGQWQAKRTYAEKCYFQINSSTDSPRAFTVRASQDSGFNLNIVVYYTGTLLSGGIFGITWRAPENALQVAVCVLSMPDAPLAVSQSRLAPLPDMESLTNLSQSTFIDLSLEPDYAQIESNLLFPIPGPSPQPTASAVKIWSTATTVRRILEP